MAGMKHDEVTDYFDLSEGSDDNSVYENKTNIYSTVTPVKMSDISILGLETDKIKNNFNEISDLLSYNISNPVKSCDLDKPSKYNGDPNYV